MPRHRRYTFHDGGITIEEFEEPDEDEYESEDPNAEVDDTEDEDEDEEEEEDEPQTGVNINVADSHRVSQNESEEKENQIRSQGVCSTSGSQEDVGLKAGETEGISCLICMEVWTDGGEHQIW